MSEHFESSYPDHTEIHHILQDALTQSLGYDKVNGMILSMNYIKDGEELTSYFGFGGSIVQLGLLESMKRDVLKRSE